MNIIQVTKRTTKRVKPTKQVKLTKPETQFLSNRLGYLLADLEDAAQEYKHKAKLFKQDAIEDADGEALETSDGFYRLFSKVKKEINKLAVIQHKLKQMKG